MTNWLKLLNNCFLITVLISGLETAAQQTFETYKIKYPDSNELVINDLQTYDIAIVDDKIKVLSQNKFESILLSENGIGSNEETFSYSNLIKLIEYDAYTENTINGKQKKIKVTQSNEKRDENQTVFHDDTKIRQLIFPNLQVGSKKVYSYLTEFTDPFLLHRFNFGSNLPTENAILEVVFDKNIEIGYTIFNDPNGAIQFKEFERKGKKVYQWIATNIKPLKFEENAPGYLHIIPNINIFIKQYKIGNTVTPVLGTVDKLYNYYKNFIKQIGNEENEALKEISLALTKNEKSDLDKIKKIYYWVKENINYIAFEDGYEGFIPRSSSLVFERKFGDCKDMGNLIYTMAKYSAIKNVFICWIGTRSIPYSYDELPTPGVDNHMIAAYLDDSEKYYFLDATDKHTKFGLPSDFIQGKEGLIGKGDTYEIIKVPVVAPSENLLDEVINMSIEGDKLIGTGYMQFHGFNRTNVIYSLGNKTNKLRFDVIKSIVLKGNNKFSLKEFNETDFENKDKPFQIDFKFEIPNYVINLDNEVYVNLFLDQMVTKMILAKDRKYSYELDHLTNSQAKYILKLPNNYKIKYLPKNESISNPLFEAQFVFEKQSDQIILTATFINKAIRIEPKDFELWNTSLNKIKEIYSETIKLEKQ
jgi:hypothetical protein